MQVVILAGGLGIRLRPLTEETCKPMMPVSGKPFLYYQLEMLRRQGYLGVLLLVGYLGWQISEYFGDGASMGMSLSYSFEDKPLGTGGALKKAEKLINSKSLLLYGDSYLPIEYTEVEKAFISNSCLAMVVVNDNREDTGVPNNIALEEDNLHVAGYDKTRGGRRPEFAYVEAGVLAFKKQLLSLIPDEGVVSLEQEIFPGLIKQRELKAYVALQKFYDMGTPAGLKAFQQYVEGEAKV